jgi:hypothetical protein
MLTVLTPATSYDLTTVETVKTELGLTGSTDDAFLGTLIRQASDDVARYCRRVLATESVREVFRTGRSYARPCDFDAPLWLARTPVVAVTSLIEDTVTLVDGTDWEVDKETGKLTRLVDGASGLVGYWGSTMGWGSVITVEYSGGYSLLPDLPNDLERCAIDLLKRRYFARSRDPALRSQQVLDLVNKSFTADGSEPVKRGLPLSIAQRLDDYVRMPA